MVYPDMVNVGWRVIDPIAMTANDAAERSHPGQMATLFGG
jgi:hypothetical protein